jgi:D-glycero-alpha-D-manno-heptose-7-phosphate kinase
LTGADIPGRVVATAPTRVDFAGGWSDVPAFSDAESGVVANAAIAIRVHVEAIRGGTGIRLMAEDLSERVVARHPADLRYDGHLDLHKAALNMLPVGGGLELLTRSDAPAGSGLGASGALDVALVAALAPLRREHYGREELAELGFHLEARELGLAGGRQDQYAAALGGVHELRFGAGGVTVSPIALSPDARAELDAMLVIAFTGHSHFSAQTHRRVWAGYGEGRADVVGALRGIRDLGGAAADALRRADWRALASVMNENWRHQQCLDATISTPGVRRVEQAARAAGAWGVKATGAGAGGCLAILAAPGDRGSVIAAVTTSGALVLDAPLDFEGLTLREDDAPDPGV